MPRSSTIGRIDGMLHFAGVIDTHGIEDTTVAHWNRVISINLLGTFLMVQAVSPLMKKQGGGRIVLTASDAARKGASISGPAYAASKGGVIALTRAGRQNVAERHRYPGRTEPRQWLDLKLRGQHADLPALQLGKMMNRHPHVVGGGSGEKQRRAQQSPVGGDTKEGRGELRVIEHLERIFVALEQTRCSEDLEAPVDADQELRRADPGLDGALLGAFDLPRDGAELARWVTAPA